MSQRPDALGSRLTASARARAALRLCAVLVACAVLAGCRPADRKPVQPAVDGGEPSAVGLPADADPPSAQPQTAPERDESPEASAVSEPASERATETEQPARQGPLDRPAQPMRPGVINDITFDDLELDMPVGTLFERGMLTPRAAQLDGQQVRLRGFIFAGGVFQQTGITNFPFVKNTQCKFGPQGLAYCVILVELDEGVTTDFTTYPVTVEGTLRVAPFNDAGFTWSVYHLQGRRVF